MRRFVCVSALTVSIGMAGCASRSDDGSKGGTVSGPEHSGTSVKAAERLTPADLESNMKKIGPTYQSVRKHLQEGATAEAGKEAEQLGELFGNVEKFWAQQNKDDAVKWAQQARTYASEVAGTAVGGNAAKAAAVADNMGAVCKQCHGTYRESDGQGGYRIKGALVIR